MQDGDFLTDAYRYPFPHEFTVEPVLPLILGDHLAVSAEQSAVVDYVVPRHRGGSPGCGEVSVLAEKRRPIYQAVKCPVLNGSGHNWCALAPGGDHSGDPVVGNHHVILEDRYRVSPRAGERDSAHFRNRHGGLYLKNADGWMGPPDPSPDIVANALGQQDFDLMIAPL